MAIGTWRTNEPRWTGWVNACETERRSLSKKAQEKSCLVLTFVEYADRRRAIAISSAACVRALRITSNLIESTAAVVMIAR
jgi:hypothetical protein